MRVKISVPNPNKIRDLNKILRRAFSTVCDEMQKDLEAVTKDWQPENQPTIEIKKTLYAQQFNAKVTAEGDIFTYVEEGTRPHIIRPLRAKALVFVPSGASAPVFAKVVHHPGYEGSHAMEEVLKEWEEKLPDKFEEEVDITLSEIEEA